MTPIILKIDPGGALRGLSPLPTLPSLTLTAYVANTDGSQIVVGKLSDISLTSVRSRKASDFPIEVYEQSESVLKSFSFPMDFGEPSDFS